MFSWFNFLVYAIVTSITPGPNNIMSMTNGKLLGIKKSLSFSFGVGIGVTFILLICAWLASTISELIPILSFPMKIIGASYMLYLAFKTFISKGNIEETFRVPSVLTGVLLQFINPKTYLYCIVSMEIYILPHFKNEPLTIILFSLLLAFTGLICTVLWAGFGKVFRLLFSQYAKITNSIMALLLVYCAISLFF